MRDRECDRVLGECSTLSERMIMSSENKVPAVVEELSDLSFSGTSLYDCQREGMLTEILSFLDETPYRYVLFLTFMVGEVYTGFASTYRFGVPHTKVFVAEEFLPLLFTEKQFANMKGQWFLYDGEHLLPTEKRRLIDRWLQNEDNYNKALSCMLYRFVEEHPDLLLTKE